MWPRDWSPENIDKKLAHQMAESWKSILSIEIGSALLISKLEQTRQRRAGNHHSGSGIEFWDRTASDH